MEFASFYSQIIPRIKAFAQANFSNGANTVYAAESAKKIVYGFFGPGATGKTACWHDSNLSAVGKLFAYADSTAPISWLGSQGPVTGGVMRSTAGGVAASTSASCAQPDLIQWMKLNPSKIFTGIHSEVLFSMGPFLQFTSGEFLQQSFSGSNVTLNFLLKPGVFSSNKPLAGVEFYTRTKSAAAIGPSLESDSCEGFAKASNFKKEGESTFGQTSFELVGYTAAQVANLDILGCPFSMRSAGRESYSLQAALSNFLRPAEPMPVITFNEISRNFNSNLVQVQWTATQAQQVSYYRMWISENPNNVGSAEADFCSNAANISPNASSFDFSCMPGANILSSTTPKYVKMAAFDASNNPLGDPKIQQMLIVPNNGGDSYYRNISNNTPYNPIDFTAATAGTAGGVTFYRITAPVPISGVSCSMTESSGALAPPHDTWDPKWISPCSFNSGGFGTWALLRFEAIHNGVVLRDHLRISTDP